MPAMHSSRTTLCVNGLLIVLLAACAPKKTDPSATMPPVQPAEPATASTPSSTVDPATAPARAGDAATAVERNLPALRTLLPGLQGSYVAEKNGAAVIVLDVYATGDAVKTAEGAQADVERLLGHPVRMQFLDAPLVRQPDSSQKR